MRKGQTKGERGLSKPIRTRLSQAKYAEIENLLKRSKGETRSSLVRKIIENKKIRVYTHDESLDLIMEELAANRAEILSIGVNINQMAKLFNTYPGLRSKLFFAQRGYHRFLALEKQIAILLDRTEQLALVWLSE